MTKELPILVLGGTGKTGRRVAERLEALGRPVRIGSRSATPAFDWEDRSTWKAALSGVSAAYIAYAPDLGLPGGLKAVEAFTATALESGVRRLVLLSGRGEDEAMRAEQALIRSGADWTIVRAAWFMQNFSESFFLDGIMAGEVVFPRDGMPEPFVDAEDIADVATVALTEDGHIHKIYEVSGSRLLTFREAFAEISTATGRHITYVPIDVEDYIRLAGESGLPDVYVELLGLLTREVLDGRNTYVTDGVSKALGRPPRDFSDYVGRTAASGAWKG